MTELVTITCPVCLGARELHTFGPTIACYGCNGAGVVSTSAVPVEAPTLAPNPDTPPMGLAAVKPCGCVVEWLSPMIDGKYLVERKAAWEALGWKGEERPFGLVTCAEHQPQPPGR